MPVFPTAVLKNYYSFFGNSYKLRSPVLCLIIESFNPAFKSWLIPHFTILVTLVLSINGIYTIKFTRNQ